MKVFVIDGPDGVGKTTLINKLVNYFNYCTSYTASSLTPSNNAYGSQVKEVLKLFDDNRLALSKEQEAFLQLTTSLRLLKELNPETGLFASKPKHICFLDRWVPSFHVYQEAMNGVDIKQLGMEDTLSLLKDHVDYTFILNASDELIDSRLFNRADDLDRYEKDKDFVYKVRTAYRNYKEERTVLVDLNHDNCDDNFKELLSIILQHL